MKWFSEDNSGWNDLHSGRDWIICMRRIRGDTWTVIINEHISCKLPETDELNMNRNFEASSTKQAKEYIESVITMWILAYEVDI